MRQRGRSGKGLFAVTFALGLIISCFCPPKFLIAVLAVWVIILGLTSCKY